MPAAYELRSLLPKEHKITVVNATDYFQFTPSNPWVAVGWRDRESITLPIAHFIIMPRAQTLGQAGTFAALWLCLAVTIFIAAICHRVIEKPAIKWASQLARSRRPHPADGNLVAGKTT